MPTNEPTNVQTSELTTETTAKNHLRELYHALEHAIVWNVAPVGTCALCRRTSEGPRHHLVRFAGGGAFARYEEMDNALWRSNPILKMDTEDNWSREIRTTYELIWRASRAQLAGDSDLRDALPLPICRVCAAAVLMLVAEQYSPCALPPLRLWERPGIQRAFRRYGAKWAGHSLIHDAFRDADSALERGAPTYTLVYHALETWWEDVLHVDLQCFYKTVTGQDFDPQQVYTDLLQRLKLGEHGFNPG